MFTSDPSQHLTYTKEEKAEFSRFASYHDKEISDIFRGYFTSRWPERGILYHYTRPQGAIGILESQSVWASSAPWLNDRNEIHNGAHFLRLALSDYASKNDLSGIMAQFFSDSWKTPNYYDDIYISSFTEHQDASVFWLAPYCTEEDNNGKRVAGRGVAFGFHAEALIYGTRLNYQIFPCIYDDEKKIEMFSSAYRKCMEILHHHLNNGYKAAVVAECLVDIFYRNTLIYLPFFKNRTWRAEAEWRIVPHDFEQKVLKKKVVPNNPNRQIVELKWDQNPMPEERIPEIIKGRSLPIVEIVMGSEITDQEVRQICNLLEAKGYKDIPITQSQCDIRQ